MERKEIKRIECIRIDGSKWEIQKHIKKRRSKGIKRDNKMTTTTEGYVYMIHEREFMVQGQTVYKIGRTNNVLRRFSQYPKGSRLLFTYYVSDMFEMENILKEKLFQKFKCRRDVGIEYFEGDYEDMLNMMVSEIIKRNKLITTNVCDQATIKARDPELLVVEFINLSKDAYFRDAHKSLEMYQSYLDWCDSNTEIVPTKQISHKEFSSILKRHFMVEIKPFRLDDGVYQCAVFDCDKRLPTTTSTSTSNVVINWVTNYVIRTHDRSDYVSVSSLFDLYKGTTEDRGLNKRKFKDELYEILDKCMFRKKSNGLHEIWRGYKIKEAE